MEVLIADDDNVNRRILERFLLKWGYDVVTASNGDEAWRLLQAQAAPRLVILDWMMPGLDGSEICREVRKRRDPRYTYILLLTAKFQKQDILEGLDSGADDYLTKPFDSNELRARLRAGRRILELQEDLIRARDRLRHQASHDAMTGIWNHNAILEILGSELARSRREKFPVCLLMADLDHFKAVNDQYGHLAGDAVLLEVVRRLRAKLRSYDALGRYGGEEFLMVLPGCDQAGALSQAERLRLAISESPLDVLEGKISLTISLGAAVGRGGETAVLDFIRSADLALYRAKGFGRDRTEGAWNLPAPPTELPSPVSTSPAP